MTIRALATAAAALCALAGPADAGDPPSWTEAARFAPPPGAAPAAEPFTGVIRIEGGELTVAAEPSDGFIRNPWAWWGAFDFLAAQDPSGATPLFELDAQRFPDVELAFFTSPEGDLVPVRRDLIREPLARRGPSFWEIVAGPGRVWAAEGAAEGWSRAAFPFSLVQSQEGEAWLGLATFDWRGDEVSPLRVQLSSVSGGGFIFWDADFDATAWAELPLSRAAAALADAPALQAAWAAERAARLPVRPFAELGEAVAGVAAGAQPHRLLTKALYLGDTLWLAPVETPFGTHPYPDAMHVGVWSITKSLVPGLAALRIAEKYGPEALDRPIVSFFEEGAEFAYLDETARARWAPVTIRHALHMATGMGAPGYDENWAMENANTYAWGYSYALADQIRFYFNVGPNPAVSGPGEALAYIDQDMWIAALAMERLLKEKEGPGASLLGMLREEVFAPISVRHFAIGTGYTPGGEEGFPFAAWGALPTIPDLARAGRLIADRGAAPDGTQILHRGLVEALFESPDYQFAFWKLAFPAEGAPAPFLPHMSGAGGQDVIAAPNGAVAIVLNRDDYNVDWSDDELRTLVAAARAVEPF